jgi:hypothetical protein
MPDCRVKSAMRSLFQCAIWFLIAAGQSAWADSCDVKWKSKYIHVETIKLKPLPQGPAFYSRAGRYVLLFQPDLVILAIEDLIKDETGVRAGGEQLMMLIKDQLPLTRNADLYSIIIDKKASISDIDRLVKSLLFSGNASLRAMARDAEVGYTGESSVIEIAWQKPRTGASGTIYCSVDKVELLAITSEPIS